MKGHFNVVFSVLDVFILYYVATERNVVALALSHFVMIIVYDRFSTLSLNKLVCNLCHI